MNQNLKDKEEILARQIVGKYTLNRTEQLLQASDQFVYFAMSLK